MAIDKNLSDSMLGTFRNMYKELCEKNATGDSFETALKSLERMEQLANEMNDFSAFSAKLTTEGLFMKFSTAYGECLSEIAKKDYSSDAGDEKLMAQAKKSYEEAIKQLEGKPDSEKLIFPIKQVIELANSGITYPVFLRICEEKGLNKALEGSTVTRDGIIKDIEFSVRFFRPTEEKMHREILEAFDTLSSKAHFGIPDSLEFELTRNRIEWKYKPEIIKWDAIISRWEKLFELIYDWADSYCDFAPYDERWADARGMTHTLRNIKRTKECNPGFLKVREKILFEYFGIKWDDIFYHETYLNEMKASRIQYSDEVINLIKELYRYCKPFSNPPEELIKKAEAIHKEKRHIRQKK